MVKRYFIDLASDCLDDNPLDNYAIPRNNENEEVNLMKVKETFYNHNTGVDFDPVIRVKYPNSRADQLSFSPTAKLVDQMFKTGQMVQASKQAYDFPDGKDDGRDVPFDRMRGLDYPEISQAMMENEAKIKAHEKNLSKLSAEKEKAAKKAETDGQSAADNGASKASDGGSGGSGNSAKA